MNGYRGGISRPWREGRKRFVDHVRYKFKACGSGETLNQAKIREGGWILVFMTDFFFFLVFFFFKELGIRTRKFLKTKTFPEH